MRQPIAGGRLQDAMHMDLVKGLVTTYPPMYSFRSPGTLSMSAMSATEECSRLLFFGTADGGAGRGGEAAALEVLLVPFG